jgi:hypothetical protein
VHCLRKGEKCTFYLNIRHNKKITGIYKGWKSTPCATYVFVDLEKYPTFDIKKENISYLLPKGGNLDKQVNTTRNAELAMKRAIVYQTYFNARYLCIGGEFITQKRAIKKYTTYILNELLLETDIGKNQLKKLGFILKNGKICSIKQIYNDKLKIFKKNWYEKQQKIYKNKLTQLMKKYNINDNIEI